MSIKLDEFVLQGTNKVKGINGLKEAGRKVSAASKVLDAADIPTLAAIVRLVGRIASDSKLKKEIEDVLYDHGVDTNGSAYDKLDGSGLHLSDMSYIDKAGFDALKDFVGAAAIIADSYDEAEKEMNAVLKKSSDKLKEYEDSPYDKKFKKSSVSFDDIDDYDSGKRRRGDRNDRRTRDEDTGRRERNRRDRDRDDDRRDRRDRDRDDDRREKRRTSTTPSSTVDDLIDRFKKVRR